MRSNALIVGSLFITAALLVGCSSGGASASAPAAATAAPVSAAPASEAPASAPASAAASAPASAAAGGITVDAKPVGAAGTVLVAGANGMTVYTFTKDVKDSGKSDCTGGCIDTWPALTVPAGATPTGGDRPDRKARDDHPRRRDAPGDLQRPAALLLQERQGARRRERHLRVLGGRQALTETDSNVETPFRSLPGGRFNSQASRGGLVRPMTAGDATLTSSFHGRSCEAGVPVP